MSRVFTWVAAAIVMTVAAVSADDLKSGTSSEAQRNAAGERKCQPQPMCRVPKLVPAPQPNEGVALRGNHGDSRRLPAAPSSEPVK
jgi:hypothetical protein